MISPVPQYIQHKSKQRKPQKTKRHARAAHNNGENANEYIYNARDVSSTAETENRHVNEHHQLFMLNHMIFPVIKRHSCLHGKLKAQGDIFEVWISLRYPKFGVLGFSGPRDYVY